MLDSLGLFTNGWGAAILVWSLGGRTNCAIDALE
jgi:hypothetical protein